MDGRPGDDEVGEEAIEKEKERDRDNWKERGRYIPAQRNMEGK